MPELKIIDPLDKTKCIYCKKEISKSAENVIQIKNEKFAHKACADKENSRELTDAEKLDRYIIQLFNVDYVYPTIKKQIVQFIKDYNFSYSGIQKSLQYFYDVKKNDINKANNRISIVPYVYQEAYNYYFNIWQAQ